jgi:hypothetical protein
VRRGSRYSATSIARITQLVQVGRFASAIALARASWRHTRPGSHCPGRPAGASRRNNNARATADLGREGVGTGVVANAARIANARHRMGLRQFSRTGAGHRPLLPLQATRARLQNAKTLFEICDRSLRRPISFADLGGIATGIS